MILVETGVQKVYPILRFKTKFNSCSSKKLKEENDNSPILSTIVNVLARNFAVHLRCHSYLLLRNDTFLIKLLTDCITEIYAVQINALKHFCFFRPVNILIGVSWKFQGIIRIFQVVCQ